MWAIGKLREPQRFLTEAQYKLVMAQAVGQRVLGDDHRETLTCMDHLAGSDWTSATATAPVSCSSGKGDRERFLGPDDTPIPRPSPP